MKTTTNIAPDLLAGFDAVLLIESPDGKYDVVRFPRGQVLPEGTFWWGVGRHGDRHLAILTTSLAEAMEWLAEELLKNCF